MFAMTAPDDGDEIAEFSQRLLELSGGRCAIDAAALLVGTR
jgi:hypothetical protein